MLVSCKTKVNSNISLIFVMFFLSIALSLVKLHAAESVKQEVADVNIETDLDSIFLNNSEIKIGDKPTIIVFGKDDCYHCNILATSLIGNSTIQGYIELNFLPYYINISDKKKHSIPYLSLNGLLSADMARLYKVTSVPLMVFVSSDGNEIMRVSGFPGEKRIIHILEFVYNDVWKNFNTQKERVNGFLEYEKELSKDSK